MEKLKDSLVTLDRYNKLILLYGFILSSIGSIKINIFIISLPLYFWSLSLIVLLQLFNLMCSDKLFIKFKSVNYRYYVYFLSGLIFLFFATYNNDFALMRIKPIIIFVLFSFFFLNILLNKNQIIFFLLGLVVGSVFNIFIAVLQQQGFEIILDMREILADNKYKINDQLPIEYWKKHPPGFSVSSIQFSYILSIVNVFVLYFIFFKKILKKNNTIIFVIVYLITTYYSFISQSKYLIISNIILLFFFVIKKKVFSKKQISLVFIFLLIATIFSNSHLNSFFNKISESTSKRILLAKKSLIFIEKFPNGLEKKYIEKENKIIINDNFEDKKIIGYLLRTAPHNFILSSSYHSGYIVFYFQIFFLLCTLIVLAKKISSYKNESFLQILFISILNNIGYGMFHNSGIYNGDPYIISIISLLITLISIKKNKNEA